MTAVLQRCGVDEGEDELFEFELAWVATAVSDVTSLVLLSVAVEELRIVILELCGYEAIWFIGVTGEALSLAFWYQFAPVISGIDLITQPLDTMRG